MDPERRRRYETKIDHAKKTLAEVKQWLGRAETSRVHLMAAYKAYQETVEAVTDLAAMRVKDHGRVPLDDYGNLNLLRDAGAWDADTAALLAKANGLRNRLVHEYNGLWDDVAVQGMAETLGALESTLEVATTWP